MTYVVPSCPALRETTSAKNWNVCVEAHYILLKRSLQWGVRPTTAILLVAWMSGVASAASETNRWSLTNWPAERTVIISNLQHVMGPLPGASRRCALDLQVLEEIDEGTFLRRQIAYNTEPESRVKAFLLVPKGKAKCPAVLALHQTHALGPKVVVGLGDSPNDEYGVELARLGYVVLAPPYPLLGEYQPDLKQLGYASGTMKAVWDNMRALDVLETLPFVRRGSFGAIGHSLGGHNALFTAAFDPRIKVVATSCGFDSFRDYMNGDVRGWTSERYMPRLLDHSLDKLPFDFHDVLAVIAPRHVFVSAPLGDTNFKWRSVAAVAQEAWKVYRLHNAEENLRIVHPDCGHVFPPEIREQAYRVFDKALR